MKTKWVMLSVAITAILIALVCIIFKSYLAAAAILAVLLIIARREIWSLLKTGRWPVVDERVSQIANKAILNSFVALLAMSLMLVLMTAHDNQVSLPPADLIGTLLAVTGFTYAASYIYYDGLEFRLHSREKRALKALMITALGAALVFIIDAFFINSLIGFGAHVALLWGSLAVFAAGALGSLALWLRGLVSKSQGV